MSWTSSNTAVATVSSTGLVTGVSAGTATITATTQNGGRTATSAVTVTDIAVTGVSVAPATLSLSAGQTGQLTRTIAPSNATNQTVNWTSGNTAVATVNSSGLVTAVAPGEATITATTVSGGFTATAAVTVVIPVTGVSVAPASLTLTAGQTAQLTETVSPANATNLTVTWSSSNTSVATVDNTGLVTASSLAGSATITATTADGAFTAQAVITVEEVASPATVLAKFAFLYKYDDRKRMTHKKVPGADWVYMVYDDRDRLVMTQDGNQRTKSTREWTFTKYDVLNRPVLTGIYLDAENKDQAGMQTKVNDFYIAAENNSDEWFEVTGGTVHGYTNQSFPNVSSEGQYLTVSYYDDYSFTSLIGTSESDYQYDNSRLVASGNDEGQEDQAFTRVKGQMTGSRIKNLGTNEWMWSVTYYDDRYRTIQVIAQNSKGGLDKITSVYDFSGKVLRTKTDHAITGATPIATTRKLTYDHAGRLLQTEHHTNNKQVVLTKNQYNEIGQLVTKKLHSEDDGESFKQNVDYRYNIRGWLSRINHSDLGEADGGPKDYFGMELGYNTEIGVGASSLQYNGNISAIKYSTNQGLGINIDSEDPILEATERGYAFEYDPMNRLTEAAHRERTLAWSPTTAYREGALQYDLNGNILHLDRKGKVGSDMDDLAYTYNGNRLMQVTDAENVLEGFKDGNVSGDDYLYDANGNMITDRNKNIETITYNHLNLPAIVTKTTGEHVNYIYNAAGVKLSQEVYDAANTLTKRTDYLGEFFYEDDILQFINHEEGRVVMTGAEPEYQYTLKDHLGNSRITFTSKEETEAPVATLETENETEERANFLKYDDVRLVNSTIFDHTDIESTQYAIRLTGTPAETYGLARSISVMPGDKITAEVFAKYVDLSQTDVTTALRDFITLVATGAASSGTVIDGGAYGSPGASTLPFGALLDKSDETGDAPKAYLNYLVFDKDYELIISKSGYQRVSVAASENGQLLTPDGKLHERLQSPEIEISQPGYVYIYLSNEEGGKEVYFDDFKVEHVKSPVIQQDDYYPFGLTFNSYQRENSAQNKFKFQGQEHVDDLGLNWDSFKWRNHQPEIGRFFTIDPLADKYVYNSPYAFSENRVVNAIELEGLEALIVTNRTLVNRRLHTATGTQVTSATIAAVGNNLIAGLVVVGEPAFGSTNISSVSSRVARHFREDSNFTPGDGGEENAFRHAFWSADMANSFDETTARQLANAHEGIGPYQGVTIDFSQKFEGTTGLADSMVDLLNNQIGRDLAANLPENASAKDMAVAVLGVQLKQGLWTVKKDKNGNISLVQSKISQAKHDSAMKTLNQLDKHGKDEADRELERHFN